MVRDLREHNERVAHSDDHLQPPDDGDTGDGMTEAERRFVELDRRKDEVKKFFDEYAAATEALVEAHGVGHFFQDDEGVVYETAVPAGRFVYYEKFVVNRTRRGDEKQGSLSLKAAREAGFEVEGK